MKDNSRFSLGLIFILIGVGALLSKMNYINNSVIMFLVSLGFFTVYFFRGGNKNYYNIGMLIPACILLVLSPLDSIKNYNTSYQIEDSITVLAISVAFFLIYFIHNLWVRDIRNRKRHWPLTVGSILAIVGVLNYVSDNYDVAVWNLMKQYSWGIILIILGVYIMLKEVFKKRA